MFAHTLFALAGVCLLAATGAIGASADDMPLPTRNGRMIHGGNLEFNKSVTDTIDLMGPTGSGAAYSGDFEAGWGGWTSVDRTAFAETHWRVSDYNQAGAGNLAAWCGQPEYPACNDTGDIAGGYGNEWHDMLRYTATVADPGASATVRVQGILQHDTEPEFDFTHLSRLVNGQLGYQDLQSWDGRGTVAIDFEFTYLPEEYLAGDQVTVLFRVTADEMWSDEDCGYASAGACQLDDLVVTISQPGQPDLVSITDFQDGTFGDWEVAFPVGVGACRAPAVPNASTGVTARAGTLSIPPVDCSDQIIRSIMKSGRRP